MTRRVIGVDPGSIKAGWAVVEQEATRLRLIGSGTIRLGDGPLNGRLEALYAALRDRMTEHAPREAAIEAIFHQRNADSALKLGHARGVALLAMAHGGLPVSEYPPSTVKKSVTGHGGADKEQVRAMMRVLLNAPHVVGLDESDAIAIAVCHLSQNPALARRTL